MDNVIGATRKQFINHYYKKISKLKHLNSVSQWHMMFEECNIRVMSWNVHMLKTKHQKNNIKKLHQIISTTTPDIIALQEVILVKKFYKLLDKLDMSIVAKSMNTNLKPYKKYYNVILVKKHTFNVLSSFSCYFDNVSFNDKRSYCVVKLLKFNYTITLINVHLDVIDVSDRTRLKQLQEIISNPCIDKTNIILGDFNSLKIEDYTEKEWKWLKYNSYTYNLEHDAIDYLEKENRYKDVFNNSQNFSVWTNRRVDYAFVKGDITITNPVFWYTNASDHLPLIFNIN